MKELTNKLLHRERRAHRVRATIRGTTTRPRLCVFRSLKHLSAQIIDDQKRQTLAHAGDTEIKGKKGMECAKQIGKLIAERAQKKKIFEVVFDRGSYAYHGQIKALAEGAREGGLKF
jgi:large subunit ribosomal protein L18